MIDLATLKTKLKIVNNAYDVDLESYLDFISPYLGQLLGIEIGKIGKVHTKVFKDFFLNSTIAPIQVWKSITKVEVAEKSQNLTWQEWQEYNQFEFSESSNIPGTLFEIVGFNGHRFANRIVRITGIYGFADGVDEELPQLITTFIVEGARQYQNFVRSKGQVIQSERSGNLSISISTGDVLTGLGTLNPASNNNLAKIISLYQFKSFYQFK